MNLNSPSIANEISKPIIISTHTHMKPRRKEEPPRKVAKLKTLETRKAHTLNPELTN